MKLDTMLNISTISLVGWYTWA